MGALPKRKISKGRRDRRRLHDKLHPVGLVVCDHCGQKRLPHRVCTHCGHYQGREIFEVKNKE